MQTPRSEAPLPADAPRPDERLLVDRRGHTEVLLGNEAIVRGALEAGVAFAAGYPGPPSSEVTDSFARIARAAGITFEYSVNEKVALEMAFAACLAGARSICSMKHLGLGVAGDPLSTIPYVGVGAGLVIVSAGDPSCHTSPNEQDQRHLGPMLHLPVLDPSTPEEACAMARGAFELSERANLPVLLRTTARVAHSRAPVRYGALLPPRVGSFQRDPPRYVPMPANARVMRRQIPERLEAAREWLRDAGFLRACGSGRSGILAAGAPAATCADWLAEHGLEEEVRSIAVGGVHPLPEEELADLCRDLDRLLVVEELSPFLEDAVTLICARRGLEIEILGKHTGHLPHEFEYDPSIVGAAIHSALGVGPAPAEPRPSAPLPGRPPVFCSGCPHRSSFLAARLAFDSSQLFFNDIGCYTLGYGPPHETADALLCMGAGFTLAGGFARVTGERAVGFVGDSTFFHAGMPALLNLVKEDAPVVAVILDNQITAMTGFQESPASASVSKPPRASIEEVVRALGVRHVEVVDPFDLQAAVNAFARARNASGVSVVISRAPCPSHLARGSSQPPAVVYRIDRERCQSCGRECAGARCAVPVTREFELNLVRGRIRGRPTPEAMPPGVAPCASACPLGLCIQGYAGHVAAGEYAEALQHVLARLPLPESVCRVCHRPCEERCVHFEEGEPVAVNDLKRFLLEWGRSQGRALAEEQLETLHDRSVAVVGAGPAGLAAAAELRARGYRVVLVDGAEHPGGLLRSGIPRFRLPAGPLERDVERILALGVEFRGGVRLGAEVGLGAGRPRELELPGAARAEPIDALDYIADDRASADRSLLVIGGGNAAVDVARLALRRGVDDVRLVCFERRAEMPAIAEEVDAAEEEGVAIETALRPVEFTTTGALYRPEDGSGPRHAFDAERVVLALGQLPDLAVLGEWGQRLEVDREGCLVVDRESGATSEARLFAAGDLVAGPRTVTDAIASGLRAAWGIDRMLRGEEAADARPAPPRFETELDAGPLPRPPETQPRRRPPTSPPSTRATSFEEIHGTLSESDARAEAARCLSCGRCGNCRACIELFGCPAFREGPDGIEVDPAACNGCGGCVELCPAGAIHAVANPLEDPR